MRAARFGLALVQTVALAAGAASVAFADGSGPGTLTGTIAFAAYEPPGVTPPHVSLVVTHADSTVAAGHIALQWRPKSGDWSFTVGDLPLDTPLIAYVVSSAPNPFPTGFVHLTHFRADPSSPGETFAFTLTAAQPSQTVTFTPYDLEVSPLPDKPTPGPSPTSGGST